MNEADGQVHGAWDDSLRKIMKDVLRALPDNATLGEIVDAARQNPQMAPALDLFMVQELIDTALERPRASNGNGSGRNGTKSASKTNGGGVTYDEEGNPISPAVDTGPAVIRRRADVPGGDLRVLKALAKQKSGRRESDLIHVTKLTAEQVRLILRGLRAKAFVHVEGSGTKRKIKITRHGSSYLRKQDRH